MDNQVIYETMKNKMNETIGFKKDIIPDGLQLSTMVVDGKFKTKFYPTNIYLYGRKSIDGVINIIGNKNNLSRPIIIKNNKKNLKQITLYVKVKNKENPVSVKLFDNGSLHFTGCVRVENVIDALIKICHLCREELGIRNDKGIIEDIKFVENKEIMTLENFCDFKVDMLNLKCYLPMKIDKTRLYNFLLETEPYRIEMGSNGNSAVIIKYKYKQTISMFESGKILIVLGNQGFEHLNDTFTYVNRLILKNYNKVVKVEEIIISKLQEELKLLC